MAAEASTHTTHSAPGGGDHGCRGVDEHDDRWLARRVEHGVACRNGIEIPVSMLSSLRDSSFVRQPHAAAARRRTPLVGGRRSAALSYLALACPPSL